MGLCEVVNSKSDAIVRAGFSAMWLDRTGFGAMSFDMHSHFGISSGVSPNRRCLAKQASSSSFRRSFAFVRVCAMAPCPGARLFASRKRPTLLPPRLLRSAGRRAEDVELALVECALTAPKFIAQTLIGAVRVVWYPQSHLTRPSSRIGGAGRGIGHVWPQDSRINGYPRPSHCATRCTETLTCVELAPAAGTRLPRRHKQVMGRPDPGRLCRACLFYCVARGDPRQNEMASAWAIFVVRMPRGQPPKWQPPCGRWMIRDTP